MNHHDDNFGDWQGLSASRQAPRYAAIAEMLAKWKAIRDVLDIGCGEGVLRRWLPEDAVYLGLELSALAIQRANSLYPSDRFIHISAENFNAQGQQFRGVVFNEMLMYAADPIGLVKKYSALLQPGGVVLCSIYQRPGRGSLRAWLRHLVDRRSPVSNIHCEKMVRAYMAREAWKVLEDRVVGSPESSANWHIWVARP